jgi:hypothetical protein
MEMRMPLGTPGLTSFKIGGKASVFDSWNIRHLTGGVTIDRLLIPVNADGERIIHAGEVIGKVTATGLYGPWDVSAVDGRSVARGVVVQDTNVTNSNAFVGAADECRVHVARMPRAFTDAEWNAITASPFVKITRAEPFLTPGAQATAVTLAPTTLSLSVGDVGNMSTVFVPANTVNTNGSWTSSDPSKATVSPTGVVTGIAAGTATITFTAQNGGFIATATVTVS